MDFGLNNRHSRRIKTHCPPPGETRARIRQKESDCGYRLTTARRAQNTTLCGGNHTHGHGEESNGSNELNESKRATKDDATTASADGSSGSNESNGSSESKRVTKDDATMASVDVCSGACAPPRSAASRWPTIRNSSSAVWFALGNGDDQIDTEAVRRAFAGDAFDKDVANGASQTPLFAQCAQGRAENVRLILADGRVDPNGCDVNGVTPLCIAANRGHAGCVDILMRDERVDVNRRTLCGESPLSTAVNNGHARCAELLLADARVDVSLADNWGQTPLVSSCVPLLHSVGTGVPVRDDDDRARCFVQMLKSNRVDASSLMTSIAFLKLHAPSTADHPDHPDHPVKPQDAAERVARCVVPVLEAQLDGRRRWCAHCSKLSAGDLGLCASCNQVGYCNDACLDAH